MTTVTAAQQQITLYVSPAGDATGDGTIDAPFATLEQARDHLRRLRRDKALAGGATVFLAGGDYMLERGFELSAEDSGTPNAPIVYRAMPGHRVRLLGGRIVRDAQRVTDPIVLARLDEHAREHVLQIDLKAQGVGEMNSMQSRGFSRPIVPSHVELFFNSQPMTLARWPNDGEHARITGFPKDLAKDDGHGSKMGPLDAGFFYDGDRPKRWADSDDIWVHGYWAYDWANTYERVASIDKEQRFVRTHPPHGLYGIMPNQRIYFLNILEELDSPGEYFVDRRRGMLYFWPPDHVDHAEMMVSLLDKPMIALSGVLHVTLRNLTLACSRGHGVTITGGSDCLVAGCTIHNVGNYGVWVDGGERHTVSGCDIHHTGDGGVNLSGGDRATLTPCGHAVHNCHFHHQARWSRCYFPSVLVAGVGSRVTHNLMHDHPHCPLLFTGNDHLFEFNEIHHVCQETGDVGGIYTGRDWTMRDNIIRHNYLHDIHGPGKLGSLSVYIDDCHSGIHILGNIFERTQCATLIGGGRDNVIENNIYIDCEPAIMIDGRGMSPQPVWQNMVNNTMKERLLAMKHHEPPYATRFPELKQIDSYLEAGKGVPPEGNRIHRNICVRGEWTKIHWGAEPFVTDVKDNLVHGDAGFVTPHDPAAAHFALRDDAPAVKLGFKPIPFEKIGLRIDEYRPAAPRM